MIRLLIAGLALALASPGLADVPKLVLDHDMLTTLARTGAPGIALSYPDDHVDLRTRHRTPLGVWVDIVLTARFVREGKRVKLALRSLSAAGIRQTGSRFQEAAAKLAKLVDVETAAGRLSRSGRGVARRQGGLLAGTQARGRPHRCAARRGVVGLGSPRAIATRR